MAAKKRAKKKNSGSSDLLTLSEVSNRTGISMPTLQRYKKLYQARIPSEGEGRKQRYPEESLPVFEEIKKENISKRGRPRKTASGRTAGKAGSTKKTPPAKKARATGSKRGPGRPPGKRGPGRPPGKRGPGRPKGSKNVRKATRKVSSSRASSELLTLSEISEMTNISYPTLVRYKKLHLGAIPHEGKGRNVRFYPEAVEVFQELRGRSNRGARPKSGRGRRASSTGGGATSTTSTGSGTGLSKGADKRIQELEKAHAKLQKRFDRLLKKLQKPLV